MKGKKWLWDLMKNKFYLTFYYILLIQCTSSNAHIKITRFTWTAVVANDQNDLNCSIHLDSTLAAPIVESFDLIFPNGETTVTVGLAF